MTCGRGVYVEPPTAVDEARAVSKVVAAETAAATAAARAQHARRLHFEKTRDRRSLASVHKAMRAALLHRCVPARYPLTVAAREWIDSTVFDLARKHCELLGMDDPASVAPAALARMALMPGDAPVFEPVAARQSAYFGTSDLARLFDGIGLTVFVDTYEDAPRTFEAWTTATTVADFKQTVVVQPGFTTLDLVAEHAEYQHGALLGVQAPIRMHKYGKVLAYTREAFLRDDMPGLAALTSALAIAAAACESDVVYDLLVSNPTMPDGQPLFSPAHGNLIAAADLTATTLTLATTALAAQTVGGQALHLTARYLLVGPALAAQARQLVTIMTPANTPAESGPLTVVEDGRIPGKAWYVTCDRIRPSIVTAHLTGADGPELLVQDGWDIDARLYKGRDEFGAVVIDYRSMVLTPGV
jgi:hypothetical protein